MDDFDNKLANLTQWLRDNPYDAAAYNSLGAIYYRTGDFAAATKAFHQAAILNPLNYQAYYNLGNCYFNQGDELAAINYYQKSLDCSPENLNVTQNLGLLLSKHKRYNEALPLLEKVVTEKGNANNPQFLEQLAECYLKTGNLLAAIDVLLKVDLLIPSNARTNHNLGVMYLKAQQLDSAIKHFKLATKLDPKDETAQHMVNALSQNNTSSPPINYVRALFDQYAPYYNQQLSKDLAYNLPNELRSVYGIYQPQAIEYGLELGCGTGLCGLYFRDSIKNFTGIDISKEMLLQAKQQPLYDMLLQANLQLNWPILERCMDLIIAADIIPYFGDLKNLFYHATNTLKANGLFLFSIELADPKHDYWLDITGRYKHSDNYITQLLNRYGLALIVKKTIAIRTQQNNSVTGNIYLVKN